MGLFVFPMRGVTRPSRPLEQRVHFIFSDVSNRYGLSGELLWVGLVLLVGSAVWCIVAARQKRQALLSPLVLLVGVTFLAQVGYALYDYQGYSHAFPLLPYGAIGFGVATAHLLGALRQRRPYIPVLVGLLVGVAALTAASAIAYYQPSTRRPPLAAEQASACAVKRSLVAGTPLWVMGNPLPLVLLRTRNPDNYPYLGSGLDSGRSSTPRTASTGGPRK